MLTKEWYDHYRNRGFKDNQICILLKCTKTELIKFKKQIGYIFDIPEHLLSKAKSLGLSEDAVRWRIKVKRWSLEEACTIPKQDKVVTQEQLNEAKAKYGLHPSTIYRRLNRGWELEEALTTKGRRKEDGKMKYKELQIIKHSLQHYIERSNATEKDIEQEKRLLKKVILEVKEMKERYGIS